MAAYKLKDVYSSNGTEMSTPLHTSAMTGNAIAYDGRYLWVANGLNGIAIYDHWHTDPLPKPPATPEEIAAATRPDITEVDELNLPGFIEEDLNTLPGMSINPSETQEALNAKFYIQRHLKLVTNIKVTATNIQRTTVLASLKDASAAAYPRTAGVKTIVDEVYTVFVGSYGDTAYSRSISRGVSNDPTKPYTALNAHYIVQLGTKMYITNTRDFNEIYEFDIPTQQFVRIIEVADIFEGEENSKPYVPGMTTFVYKQSYPMLSNLCAANGKLWMTGRTWDEAQPRKLYTYNPTTNAFASTYMHVRQGIARCHIAHGYNGYVYVTNFNGMGITKYDVNTGQQVKDIRVNGNPQGIWSDPDKRIWVASYGGMLSKIDWDDDGVHNDYATESPALRVQVDPTDTNWIWFINGAGKLAKYNTTTFMQWEYGTTEDFQFYGDNLSGSAVDFVVVPGFQYERTPGEMQTVKPRIFVLTAGGHLVSWFIGGANSPDDRDASTTYTTTFFEYKYPWTDYPYRTVYAEMTGVAAVALVVDDKVFFGT